MSLPGFEPSASRALLLDQSVWCAGHIIGCPLWYSSLFYLESSVRCWASTLKYATTTSIPKLQDFWSEYPSFFMISRDCRQMKIWDNMSVARSSWAHLLVQIWHPRALNIIPTGRNPEYIPTSHCTELLRSREQPLYVLPSLKFETCSGDWRNIGREYVPHKTFHITKIP
jgi:hypothetical protein